MGINSHWQFVSIDETRWFIEDIFPSLCKKYPNIVFVEKSQILTETTENPYLPWRNKESLIKTILENFKEFNLSKNELRSFLGNFLFSGDDVFKKVIYLSPGERSRVALAKLALTGANLLILDEPTNHLDPQTQEIIANTFKTFEGTMLVVSHNVDFVNNLGIERMLMLPSGEIRYYDKDTVLYYQELNNKKKI